MRIKEWLARNDKTAADFARELDFNRVYIQQICSGTKFPGKHLVAIIALATNNQVTERDWLLKDRQNTKKINHGDANKEKKEQHILESSISSPGIFKFL